MRVPVNGVTEHTALSLISHLEITLTVPPRLNFRTIGDDLSISRGYFIPHHHGHSSCTKERRHIYPPENLVVR
jgi:hypothetical protein